jgi:SAM-dependent methyltransferase
MTQAPEKFLADRLPPSVRLFAISFLTLYFELVLVRWLPTQIRILAYFSNLTLIGCVLGLGLGALIAQRRKLIAYAPAFIVSLMGLAWYYHGFNVQLPLSTENLFIWNGLSRYVKGTAFQYVGMFVFFSINVLVFVPLGQVLGVEFDKFKPIRAYTINLFGSLAGILCFAVISALSLSPPWWFLVGAGALLLFVPLRAMPVVATLSIVIIAGIGQLEPGVFWSPYYKIDVQKIAVSGVPVGFDLRVNDDSHQQALALDGRFDRLADLATRRAIYDMPYRYGSNEDVLVVGAGTGNDVAAALRAGAKRVTAVEIDPVISRIGVERHPERPYGDPRVRLVVQDARNFLRRSGAKYDKIVLGYLDSHSLFSAMSSLRLDNFIYTRESFREMRGRLEPDGMIAVTFTVHEKWIADRLFGLFEDAFGTAPVVFQGAQSSSCGTVFLGGAPVAGMKTPYVPFHPVSAASEDYSWQYSRRYEGFLSPAVFERPAVLPSDDWPYLYSQGRTLPPNYLICLAAMLLFALATIGRSGNLRRIEWQFFFLGAAFLLLETKGITELAIFFGSTWLVNTIVIAAVLVFVLLANLLIQRGVRVDVRIAYALLVGSILAGYFVDVRQLLGVNPILQNVLAAGLVCSPMFFAGLIFSLRFREAAIPSAALGANLLGAVVGGALEYASLVVGFRMLYLIAIGLYALSFVAGSKKRTA